MRKALFSAVPVGVLSMLAPIAIAAKWFGAAAYGPNLFWQDTLSSYPDVSAYAPSPLALYAILASALGLVAALWLMTRD